MESATLAFCSTSSMVVFSSWLIFPMMRKISCTSSGASPSEGSSSRISRGRAISAEQGDDLSRWHLQREALEHEDHVVVDDLDVREPEHGDCGGHGRSIGRATPACAPSHTPSPWSACRS